MLQNAAGGNKAAMRAYLAFMGPRLAEMHRTLKDTGSIYLHCDPTASHYLKGLMDAIWDQDNHRKNEYFRNEIVWCYAGGGIPRNDYPRKHDVILRYSKSKNVIFNTEYRPYGPHNVDGRRFTDRDGTRALAYRPEGTPINDWWTDIKPVINLSNERLGYPTQKPRALYERMIQASSNKGMLVMDPFCGCGTTIDAAHTLKRAWIGIDLTIIALDPIRLRMSDRHGIVPHQHYDIDGYPTNMQEVRKLVRDEKKYHDFSNWAVTRLGLRPTPDVADGGKDGVGHVVLWNPDTEEDTPRRILAEVKSGKPTLEQVRAFCHTMNEHNAVAGVFITIAPVSRGMRQLAADMGEFEHINNKKYPKLQFWQIDDAYFENPEILKQRIRLPMEWIQPRKKSERHVEDRQLDLL